MTKQSLVDSSPGIIIVKMRCINLVLCLFLLPCIFCDCPKVQYAPRVDGYYWRDYVGYIPPDAAKGGTDIKGRPIYIGQTLKEHAYGAIIVGNLDAVDEKMYYPWEGNVYTATENIKILCSQNPKQFQWVRSNITQLRESNKNNLVVGGFDTYPLYIARVNQGNGAVAVGKLTLDLQYQSFAYVENNKAHVTNPTLEVLTYKLKN